MQRIDGPVVQPHLEMQMRAGGAAGGADIADDLALADAHALADAARDAALVGVERHVAIVVADHDGAAIAAAPGGVGDDAIAGGVNGGAPGRAEIDAGVHFRIAQNGMAAHAEAGGNARARDGGAHQAADGGAALFVIIAGAAAGRGEAVIGDAFAMQIESGVIEHLAPLRRAGQRRAIENVEGVALGHLPLQVDAVGEGAQHLADDVAGNMLIPGGGVKRGGHPAAGADVGRGGGARLLPALAGGPGGLGGFGFPGGAGGFQPLGTGGEVPVLIGFDDDFRAPAGLEGQIDGIDDFRAVEILLAVERQADLLAGPHQAGGIDRLQGGHEGARGGRRNAQLHELVMNFFALAENEGRVHRLRRRRLRDDRLVSGSFRSQNEGGLENGRAAGACAPSAGGAHAGSGEGRHQAHRRLAVTGFAHGRQGGRAKRGPRLRAGGDRLADFLAQVTLGGDDGALPEKFRRAGGLL